MVRTVFADTWYWQGLASPRDHWAAAAQSVSEAISDARILTTDEVLTEFLAAMSKGGPTARVAGVKTVRAILEHPNVTVVPQTRSAFLAGLDLYERRSDKGYSLVDCISMNTMWEYGVSEVLTGDAHFTQEGFVTLPAQKPLPG